MSFKVGDRVIVTNCTPNCLPNQFKYRVAVISVSMMELNRCYQITFDYSKDNSWYIYPECITPDTPLAKALI